MNSARRQLCRAVLSNTQHDPLMQCLAPSFSRSLATESSIEPSRITNPFAAGLLRRPPPLDPGVTTTVYNFPDFEPLRHVTYPRHHLGLPIRPDILQRAVIFEADNSRQGTANTKWRDEVRGSGRKLRPQKGSGRARLGDKKSPMLRGGGVAFGPKPRDFSTKLPRKIYDLAWRTALSYRYKRGELVIVQKINEEEISGWRWLQKFMDWNALGRPRGSMFITRMTPGKLETALFAGKEQYNKVPGEVQAEDEIDVKDLLKYGRLVIEKRALDSILKLHSSDLVTSMPTATYDY